MSRRSLKLAVPSGLILLMAFLFLLAPTALAQSPRKSTPETADTGRQIQDKQDTFRIEPGVSLEKTLSGGEFHTYEINLNMGQYIDLVVDQRGIDVVLILYDPTGKQILEVDSPNGTQGPEPVSIVAEASGAYRLEVRPMGKAAATGRYEIKIENLRQAISQDRDRDAAERIFSEANQFRAQGKADSLRKAIEKYNEALPLMKASGNKLREALTLNYLGVVYDNLGELQKALDYYSQALLLTHDVADKSAEANTLNNIGVIYTRLGELQKALDSYAQALPLRRLVGDKSGEGNTLSNIGAVYVRLGERQKALDYYLQALPLMHATGNNRGEASVLNNLGAVYLKLGEGQKALDYYAQALPLIRAAGNRYAEAVMLRNIGGIYSSQGEKQQALEYLGQALSFQRAVGDQYNEPATLQAIAQVERDLGHLTEARAHIEAALNLIESMRAKVASHELRTSYLGSQQGYYEFYVDLLMRLHQLQPTEGYDALALQATERARARSLLELLNEARLEIRQGVDPVLLEREHSLQKQLNGKAELQMRLLSAKASPEQVAALVKETDELITRYQDTEAEIRVKSPRYADLTQPVPLNLKEIQQQLGDPGMLLLEYALGDERSYLWAVTSTSMRSFVLPGRKQIELAARRVYDLLTARNLTVKFETADERRVRIARADAAYPGAATVLSEMVLAPVVDQLGTKRLVIVSDGALQYVPFAALPLPHLNDAMVHHSSRNSVQSVETTQFLPLVVDHEIVDVPSASTLAVLRRELDGRKEASRKIAVIADPVFDKEDDRVRGRSLTTFAYTGATESPQPRGARGQDTFAGNPDVLRSGRESGLNEDALRIPRLQFTRREALAIAALVPAAESKVFLDFAANRAAAMSPELAQYRYVHFATHGLLNTVHPELSGIVLSLVDNDGRDQDGFLRAFEVFNLRLNADMVVLSGCRTGLGKEVKGEGLLGLTRGFMYAGAHRVLVSIWGIPDEASAELMVQTYKEMLGKDRLRPGAALRAAQIKMWKGKRWQAPYFWAGFVLRGEPN